MLVAVTFLLPSLGGFGSRGTFALQPGSGFIFQPRGFGTALGADLRGGSGGNAWLCPSTLLGTRGGGCSRAMKPVVGRGGFGSAPAHQQPEHCLGWAPDC